MSVSRVGRITILSIRERELVQLRGCHVSGEAIPFLGEVDIRNVLARGDPLSDDGGGTIGRMSATQMASPSNITPETMTRSPMSIGGAKREMIAMVRSVPSSSAPETIARVLQ